MVYSAIFPPVVALVVLALWAGLRGSDAPAPVQAVDRTAAREMCRSMVRNARANHSYGAEDMAQLVTVCRSVVAGIK